MPNCKIKRCKIRAFYNYENEMKGLYCNTHKLENMIDVLSSKCIFENCKIRPHYNYENETKGLYCNTHKLENMINVINLRCIVENCNIIPHYNYENETKGLYCVTHKLENMINIKSKQCLYEDCKIQPVYNYENETKGLYCATHKLENMIDILSSTCIFKNCNIKPYYNYENETKGLYCATHKLENMVNITNNKCVHEGCNIQPVYNYENKIKGIYCNEHKLENMINIKSKKCKEEHCNTIQNLKYRGYCMRCFMYTFPDEPVTRHYRIKEKHVKDFIQKEFQNHIFINDKQISGGCSKRRPDFYLDCLTHIMIIENDENGHENYSCENKRMMQLFIDGGSIPSIFIRFNPDSFIDKNGTKIESCFEYHKSTGIPIIKNKDKWQERLQTLKNKIHYHINNIPSKEITIECLYYDHINN